MESLINDLSCMRVSEKNINVQEILGFYMPISLNEWNKSYFNGFLNNINKGQQCTYYVNNKASPFCWVFSNGNLNYTQWKDGYSFVSERIKMDYGIAQNLLILEATINSVIDNKELV